MSAFFGLETKNEGPKNKLNAHAGKNDGISIVRNGRELELEKSFLNMLHNSGYPDIKFEKKIDFENLYMQRFN